MRAPFSDRPCSTFRYHIVLKTLESGRWQRRNLAANQGDVHGGRARVSFWYRFNDWISIPARQQAVLKSMGLELADKSFLISIKEEIMPLQEAKPA